MGAKTEPAREPPDQPLPPGCVLEDRFVIRKLLGMGGMGEVYEAEDLRLNGTRIALKTIRADRRDFCVRRRNLPKPHGSIDCASQQAAAPLQDVFARRISCQRCFFPAGKLAEMFFSSAGSLRRS